MERDSRDNPEQIEKDDDSINQNNPQPIESPPEELEDPVAEKTTMPGQSFAAQITEMIGEDIFRDRQLQFEVENFASRERSLEQSLECMNIYDRIGNRSAFALYRRESRTEPDAGPRPDGNQAAATLPLVKAKPLSPTTKAADHEVLKINSVFKTIHDAAGREVDTGSKGGKTAGKADEGVKGDESSSILPPGKTDEGKKASEVNEGAQGGNAGGGTSGNKGEPNGDTGDSNDKSEGSGNNEIGRSGSSESQETSSSESRGTDSSGSGRTGSSESEGTGSNEEEGNGGDDTGNGGASGASSGGGRTYTIFHSTGPGIPTITVTPPTPPAQRRPTIHPPFKREVDPRCRLPSKSPKKE